MITIKTPTPTLVFADFPTRTVYAWKCEDKTLGIQTLGNSKAEAMQDFRECIADEMIWMGKIASATELTIIG